MQTSNKQINVLRSLFIGDPARQDSVVVFFAAAQVVHKGFRFIVSKSC